MEHIKLNKRRVLLGTFMGYKMYIFVSKEEYDLRGPEFYRERFARLMTKEKNGLEKVKEK